MNNQKPIWVLLFPMELLVIRLGWETPLYP